MRFQEDYPVKRACGATATEQANRLAQEQVQLQLQGIVIAHAHWHYHFSCSLFDRHGILPKEGAVRCGANTRARIRRDRSADLQLGCVFRRVFYQRLSVRRNDNAIIKM